MANPQFPYPFFSVQITKEGVIFQPSEVDALVSGLTTNHNPPTDLLFLSHGWNNNIDDAKSLYSGLVTQFDSAAKNKPELGKRTFAICGLLWPSKKFEDKDLIPSGAAALNDSVTDVKLRERVSDLKDLVQANGWPAQDQDPATEQRLSEVEAAIEDWEDDPELRKRVVETIRQMLPRNAADGEDASDKFFDLKPEGLLNNLSKGLKPPPNVPSANAAALDPFAVPDGGGVGGAASFRDVMGGLKAGFLHLLNFTTYYMMKARAGDAGVKAAAPLLQHIWGARPGIRIHLIGHSFGCRLLASAVNALPANENLRPVTMTLLQGAFSHNGFAAKFDGVSDGAFRQVIAQKRVQGPILITHTRNDKAVGLAYPIASRIAGQVASAIGDENDLYGGLGSNGAQTAETTRERVAGTLLPVGGEYPFAAGHTPSTPFNLRADQFISGHSDIVGPEVGFAIATAIASSQSR